jgi:hypothetical protein
MKLPETRIPPIWPRIKDLPEAERESFREFLTGQTVPWIEGVASQEQDGYYLCDYQNWKRNPQNRFFD